MRLQNPKHEAFAQAVATGEGSATAAYKRIWGTAGKSAEQSASRLLNSDKVASRVTEIRQLYLAHRADEEALGLRKQFLTLDAKREYLARIVRTPIGEITQDSDLCAAFEDDGKGRRKIKMADKLRAIELDAKLAGELKGDNGTQVSLTVVVTHAQVLDRVRAMSPVLAGLTQGRN